MFFGVLSLPWWGDVVVALLLTHVTIVAVTVFLHRHQAHHALDLHPIASHFVRLWLWLTTGMAPHEARALQTVEPWLDRDERLLRESERARLAELLPKSHVLQTMVATRHELAAVWGRSMATREQLVAQLQDWCRRAETSEIKPLADFSRQLRCYA